MQKIKKERQRAEIRNWDCGKSMYIWISYPFQTRTFKTEMSHDIPTYHIRNLWCNNHRHSTLHNQCLQVPHLCVPSRTLEASGKKCVKYRLMHINTDQYTRDNKIPITGRFWQIVTISPALLSHKFYFRFPFIWIVEGDTWLASFRVSLHII